jgi:hypothetical protein
MEQELATLAIQVDTAADTSDADLLNQLDSRCAVMLEKCKGSQSPIVWYYRSNIQAALQNLEDPRSWRWRQPYRERQILYLRKARAHTAFLNINPIICAQVTTNLANSLNHLGRCVEAIALHDEALRHQPGFAMALGNRGLSRMEFAGALHDRGHAIIILLAAYDDFIAASSPEAFWEGDYQGVREQFIAKADEIANVIDIAAARSLNDLESHSLGHSKQEKAYRRWALEHQLFLNPINMLGAHAIASTDHFGLPEYRSPIGEPPQFIAWFNQLKQEYAAARLLLFEAKTSPSNHFADRKLMLVDTLDYPAFSLALEKMRLAFRSAYSLLDKVAGFINAYFQFEKKPDRVDFRNVWLKDTKNPPSLLPKLEEHANLQLRGLYWLSFDIVGNEPNEPDAIEPEAMALKNLRHALEHRCLILREFDTSQATGIVENLTVDAFHGHTLTMIKLARAALIYLSLAVGQEERLRKKTDKGLAVSMILPTYTGKPRL